jgi:hypothetical protein
MVVAKVWLLIVYGMIGCGDGSYCRRNPTVVVDNLVSKEQCVALGQRITARSNDSTYICTGLTKAK